METLYFNGDILTMEDDQKTVEAVLVSDGKICAVGNYDVLLSQKSAECVLYDLQGKTLMPSFLDGHSHFTQTAQFMNCADLSGAESFADIVEILKNFMLERDLTHGEHIVGYGYDHNFLKEKTHPDKHVLDEVSKDFPVMIWHASSHMGVVNSKTLELTGLLETPNLENGVIGRYPGTQEPTGFLEEAAMRPAKCLANPQKQDMAELLVKAQELYLANGITTVQDGASTNEKIKEIRAVGSLHQLKVDVVTYPCLLTDDVQSIMKTHADCVHQYVDHVKIGGYKILLDGSPQGKTAWLSQPYENSGEYKGYPWLTEQQAHMFVKQAIEDNMQLLAHCNGDAASQQFIDVYEEELASSQNPTKNLLRPVMIHCQTVREDQLERMKAIDMIPSIFVAHIWYWGDIHLRNLGVYRANRISPVKSALTKGLMYNFHTDTPVVPPNMLHSVWAAVNRITRGGTLLSSEQCVDVYAALKGITINTAYAYFEEEKKGSIKEGKQADLVILDNNPLKVDKMDIQKIQVLATIKDGVMVYKNHDTTEQ